MTDQSDASTRVQASPEKRFFIGMLVKDIELLPAILDLVDNSVDGARRLRGDDPYDGLEVKISINAECFEISDNCGGIPLDIARDYAFRFGRPQSVKGTPGSVGQFGVGMKRALFKLGKFFTVDSRAENTHFTLSVDVDEWAEETDPDWTFTLSHVDESYNPEGDQPRGTHIIVKNLHDTVAEDFTSSQTVGNLRYQLRLRHREAMDRGMRIVLQEEAVTPFIPQLQQSDSVRPLFKQLTLNEDEKPVNVRIYAGVTDAGGPEEDDQAELFPRERDAGWYVFCNNRLLIAADRTTLTGWGDGLPVYHPQYRRFRGYVFIDSAYNELLPWNTTKTGVDQDSRVWRKISTEIKQAGSEVIQMLNRVKSERQNAELPDDRPIAQALTRAKPVRLGEISPSPRFNYPAPKAVTVRPNMRKIQYSVEKHRYDAVAEALNTTLVADVGRRTFDFFYREQVGDDE
ncbi:ATP-binding protein [Streptomyces sp. S.PB5]|uniref:ATP-binding protein n=1 Tax=Streptomyces sp. S.PB5 TaxID=3020844 RepID=UPI0025AEDAED|nr:ATP-binding protein [Streptomyces sp. S.PB5]MDN3029746.1 ATP-binding protein [Streptomyces sp. S.PB5]